MAELYADENFHSGIVEELRRLGHDVLTANEAGQAHQRIPDSQVLAYAIANGRTVLTHNRRHFIKLHQQSVGHKGIIVVTNDDQFAAAAYRIHLAVLAAGTLDNKLIRVNKPARP